MMTLLAAIDRNNAIGKENALLYRVPEDMKHFRALTLGNLVICGRKTLESFPNGKPLPKRDTLLLSTKAAPSSDPSLTVARSIEEVLSLVEAWENKQQDVFVIGGARVYEALYPYCERAILTEIDAETPDADAFFPQMRVEDGWSVSESTPWMTSETGIPFRYVIYTKS